MGREEGGEGGGRRLGREEVGVCGVWSVERGRREEGGEGT